jgi:serine/threonine protein kinase
MSDEDRVSESFFDVSELPSEENEDDDPLVGTVLDGRYRLDRLLGEGGMGRVYAGTQLSVGREVAIKLLRGEALAQKEVKERFLREAQVISGFSHPNIVRLIDYGEDTERRLPYLVMELVRGVSLGDLTRRGRLDLPLALEIAYQVCGALVQAHSAGIIHRDLKPDNLQLMPVVGDSFAAKVLDFGIAFPRESDSRITSTGMICGTAYYIAPEQARAMEIDGRADLYALGVILYQMLSGHLPFRGDSDFQILLMQVQETPPALSDYLPPDEVPSDVIKLVHDLLAKDPNQRPPSARAVRERIEVIRKRCAIAPLQLDLETASADAFERWILAPAKTAPIIEASTALDGSTPPDVRKKLEGRRNTMVEDGGNTLEDDTLEDDKLDEATIPDPPAHAQGRASDQTPAELPSKTGDAEQNRATNDQGPTAPLSATRSPTRIIAVLAVAIIAAGGVALYLWQSDGDSGADDAQSTATAQGDGDEAPGTGEDDGQGAPGVIAAPTAALSAFAGRCMVIGESDTWFHSVFLYPEVGELLLHGDERLLWSRLEIFEHFGQSLTFTYRKADDAPTAPTTVRTSTDKLIFQIDGDSSTDKKSKFVCRKHDVQKYYDTLGVSGTFRHVDDETRETVVPSSGQRITIEGEEFVYRILGGATLSEGHELALRPAEDTSAAWESAKIDLETDTGVLSIVRGGAGTDAGTEQEQYQSKEAARAAAKKAKREAAEEAARRKQAARAKARRAEANKSSNTSSDRASSKQAQSASSEADFDDPDALPPHLRPAPKRVFDKYEKKVRESVDRYCDVMDERSAQVAHHQKLVDEKRYDEAKTYRDEVLNDTAGYSQKIQAASYGYSNAVQRAAQSGLNSVQIQKLTRMWQNGCE